MSTPTESEELPLKITEDDWEQIPYNSYMLRRQPRKCTRKIGKKKNNNSLYGFNQERGHSYQGSDKSKFIDPEIKCFQKSLVDNRTEFASMVAFERDLMAKLNQSDDFFFWKETSKYLTIQCKIDKCPSSMICERDKNSITVLRVL